jgi:N-methylhydantoinase B
MPETFDMRWLEPLRLTLQGIADRMQHCLVAGAHSTVAREGGDCAAALFLPDGRLLAQARSLPLLLGSLIPAVSAVIERFPVDTMRAGDGFLLNDPWHGGSHLPDLVVVRPILVDGAVMALAASNLHHQDVGGMTPGSLPPDAREIFHEGMRIPPVRAWRDDTGDEAVRAILRANSRTPDLLDGDLGAQWAAACLGDREIGRLVARHGCDAFLEGGARLIAETERMTRLTLQYLPDGQAQWDDALDGDGIGEDPVRLHVTVRKHGDGLDIDFTGSQAQTAGPVNASPAAMLSAALFFMRTLVPDAPNNAGCLVPLRFVLPPGSVVNPDFPAALNARTATVKLAANAVLGAWSRYLASVAGRMPDAPADRVAANAGVATVISVGGRRRDGTRYFFTEIIASGTGGSSVDDGVAGMSTDVSNARNTPVEILEARAPVCVRDYAVNTGSGGAGLHRGGDGVVRSWTLLEGTASVSYRGERHLHRAQGLDGGCAGACSAAWVERRDGTRQDLPARARVDLAAGDSLVVCTAGGGGWGMPPP